MHFEHFSASGAQGIGNPKPFELAAPVREAATLEALWSSMRRGSLVVLHTHTAPDHVAMTLGRRQGAGTPAGGTAADGSMLEAALCGRLQNAIALDSELAASTVASRLRLALERMGVEATLTRVPLALPLLAQAARRPGTVTARTIGHMPEGLVEQCVLHLNRTESRLAGVLTPAELAVAGLLLEGKSHEEIRALRRASGRTIANQICAVGRKLGTRGRFDLLRASLEDASDWPRRSGFRPPDRRPGSLEPGRRVLGK